MIKYLIAFALSSTFAMACPNLAGNYTCDTVDDNGMPTKEEVIVEQKIENGVTVYTTVNDGLTYIADGKVHELDGGQYTATCLGNLSLQLHLSFIDPAVTVKADMNLKADAKALHQSGKQSVSYDGQVFEEEINVTCKRN